jgi:integrase
VKGDPKVSKRALSLATGARRGELLASTWPDLDFESGIMTVSKSLEQARAGFRVKTTKSSWTALTIARTTPTRGQGADADQDCKGSACTRYATHTRANF